jgi:molybdopterin synthase sulfur carrier subunit
MARVLFFGRLRDVAGVAQVDVEASTLAQLRALLGADNPELARALAEPGTMVAVDMVMRRDHGDLASDSEVAFMSPLSGG